LAATLRRVDGFTSMGQATKPVIPMSDDLERRSWLISGAYDVLQRMEAPPAEATDMAIFLALSQAFSNESLAVASRAPVTPKMGASKRSGAQLDA
jgi:hypothetical protein